MEKCKTDHCVSQQSHFRTQTKTSTLTLFPCRGSRSSLVETLTSFGIAFQLAFSTTFVVIVVLVVHFLTYAFQHKSFSLASASSLSSFRTALFRAFLCETVVRLNHFAWAFALILLSHIFDPCLYSWSRSFLFDPLFILLGTESFVLPLVYTPGYGVF